MGGYRSKTGGGRVNDVGTGEQVVRGVVEYLYKLDV